MNKTYIRKDNERIEAEVARFIDKYLWSKTNRQFQRITEQNLQFKGVDIIIDGKCKIDEKVKYYKALNQFIDCPSFEILTKNRCGNYMDGWMVRDGQMTDRYMFISIGTKATDYKNVNEQTIDSLSCCIVSKREIENYIYSNNDDLQTIKDDADRLKDEEPEYDWSGNLRKPRHRYHHRNYWLTFSPSLDEQPVNLVIPRSNLIKLKGTIQLEVTRTSIRRI